MASEKLISLKEAIVTGVVLDFILLGIASTIMDGGMMFGIALSIAIGHWVGNGVVLLRRRSRCSTLDRNFIRFGFFAIIPLAVVVGIVLVMISD